MRGGARRDEFQTVGVEEQAAEVARAVAVLVFEFSWTCDGRVG